ncbi:MAG TPA: DCC1-like thiol-disulfide oxidoreductase family protein [Ignavibacteriaceae bacterium]|nr:DCC1-like thiol-disulfide oxidoreductase family protein [Ignavibacteriaceae bacterium]
MNKFADNLPAGKKVILFDGVCNFCNFWVNFIIDRDDKDLFRFASLQSDFGQSILKYLNLSTKDFDTFVLLESKEYFIKSTAALKVIKDISGWLKILYPFIILPEFIRDSVYNLIAQNRYKIFGKLETCRVPTDEEKSKFIE